MRFDYFSFDLGFPADRRWCFTRKETGLAVRFSERVHVMSEGCSTQEPAPPPSNFELLSTIRTISLTEKQLGDNIYDHKSDRKIK